MSVLILYVEDEILIQDLFTGALEEAGFKVLTASSGAEALERLETSGCDIGGLVTDVNLGGGVKGWDVGRHARRLAPGLPVLYVSGGSEHEWAVQGVPSSVMIAKPCAAAQVVAALSQLIEASARERG